MKLSALPFLKKEKPSEYFLALLLRDEKASAFVFEGRAGKIHIVGEGHSSFLTSIEDESYNELLQALDTAIAKAEENLPTNIETHKTVFGLKEIWIEDGKIKKDYLTKLKKVSDTLQLSPIGFLTISEAITHVLQQEEGIPISALLIEIGKKTVQVALIRAGRIIEIRRHEIVESILKTVETILKHFTNYEVLPARMILFDGTKGEGHDSLIQEFIGYPWNKHLPFLHMPQVTSLPAGFDAKAVLVGTAAQMGFEVLAEQKPNPPEIDNIQNEKEFVTEKTKSHSSLELLGFVKNQDIKDIQQEDSIIDKTPPLTILDASKEESDTIEEDENEIENEPSSLPQEKILPTHAITHSVLEESSAHQKIPFTPPNFNIPTIHLKNKIIAIPLITVVIVFLIVGWYFLFLKATVTLLVKPKIVTHSQSITFSENPSDFSKHIIQSKSISVSKDGSVTTSTTGKKEIGEKAKGQVTIYNSNLSESINLSKGTKIKAPNDLEFVLEDSVTVASASGDASDIKSSTTKVSIIANNIGKESNLPSNTKFSVDNLSSSNVVAKNDAAFSGGSKKEVRIVAQKDIDKLTNELAVKIEPAARDEITKKVDNDSMLIPNSLSPSTTKKELSKKPGDEAEFLTLKGSVSYLGLTYSQKDLQEYVDSFLDNRTPSSVILASEGIKTEIKNVKRDGKQAKAMIEIKAPLIAKIDTKNLSQELAGDSFAQLDSLLTHIPQLEDIEVSLSPSIPFLPKMLPRRAENITIVVKSHE